MLESKLSVLIIAPEGTAEPFRVTIRSWDEQIRHTKYVRANEKAVFHVPEGCWWMCVHTSAPLSPGGQCKAIHTKMGCNACYTAVFLGEQPQPGVTVTITAQDANYPNIIPINGGITYMADQERTINFVNGVAENVTLPVGNYTFVSSQIPGYTTATATDFTITRDTQTVTVTLTADGVLNIQVVDDLGNSITAGSLNLSNADGTTVYGSPVDIGTDGTATFNNVPYDTTTPVNVWVDQAASDPDHEPIDTPQAVEMDANPTTETIINDRVTTTVTVNATDANYPGITPLNGTLTYND